MMFSALAVLLVLLCSTTFAGLTYIGTYNGSNLNDPSNAERFSQPSAMIYLNGKLYVADAGTNYLYTMAGNYTANGSQRLFLATPKIDDGSLSNPLRMETENGTIYIADGTTGRIKYYPGYGSTLELWNSASNVGKATGIAIDNQSLYITDGENGVLLIYSRQTRSYSRVGLEKGGSDGQLFSPADIRLYNGKFYISDADKNLIFVYDANLKFEYTVGRGKGGVELRSPKGMKIYQDRIYVADKKQNRVVVFTLDGYPVETLNRSPSVNFSYPEDIAVGGGKLYVADSGNGLVHIFAINYSSANDSVMQGIAQARQAAASLQNMQQAAGKLGLTYENVSFDADLASAQSYYDKLLFSTAASISQKVIESSGAAQAALGATIDIKARQISKEATDKVAPYRQKAAGTEFAAQLAAMDSSASQLQAKLSAKDYVAAVPLALGLRDSASSFVASYEAKNAENAVKAKSQQLQALNSMKSSVEARVASAKAKAKLYQQSADFSNVEKLLEQSSSEISAESLEAANHSLYLADFETSSFETALASSAKEIDSALANLTVMEFEMNASISKPMLLPPNVDTERGMVAQAKLTVYSNPQLGLAMAAQAREAARAKAKEAQTVSVAAAALLMMLGLIGAISAAFYLHLRSRQRKQDAREKEEAPRHAEEERRKR
jgi:hypothetical protein